MDAQNVIPVDFKKDYNEAATRMARLLGLAEEVKAKLASDPAAFLREAHSEITRLRREMKRARDSLSDIDLIADDLTIMVATPTVCLFADEYRRLKACEAIVRGWD